MTPQEVRQKGRFGWRSRRGGGRPKIAADFRQLILEISVAKPCTCSKIYWISEPVRPQQSATPANVWSPHRESCQHQRFAGQAPFEFRGHGIELGLGIVVMAPMPPRLVPLAVPLAGGGVAAQ